MAEILILGDSKTILPFSRTDWHFCCTFACAGPNLLGAEAAHAVIPLLLHRSRSDPRRMLSLRTFFAQGAPPWPVYRMRDEEVLQEISYLLNAGKLHVHVKSQTHFSSAAGAGGGTNTAASTGDYTEPPASRRIQSAPPPPVSDPATLPSTLDGYRQAAALITAAKYGTPFCAMCEAAKRAS